MCLGDKNREEREAVRHTKGGETETEKKQNRYRDRSTEREDTNVWGNTDRGKIKIKIHREETRNIYREIQKEKKHI